MWFRNLWLLVTLSSVTVFGQIQLNIQHCLTGFEDVESLVDRLGNDTLGTICQPILNLFECADDAVKAATNGLTVEELLPHVAGEAVLERLLMMYINFRNVSKELCNEDSQFRQDYNGSYECFGSVSSDGKREACEGESDNAVQIYEQLEDSVKAGIPENVFGKNEDCLKESYKVACMGVQIHETCSELAFNTYMQILKRSTFFKYGICTEYQLNILKDAVLDKIYMEAPKKDLYRLAYQL